MSSVSPRIEDLRRRVETDPASIAFAQLAEEYRRAGDCEQAVRVCEAGLARHPDYLSARVTLGRALFELGRLDEARSEFTRILEAAPDNPAAIGKLAEINEKTRQTAGVDPGPAEPGSRKAEPRPAYDPASDPVLIELQAWLDVVGERRK